YIITVLKGGKKYRRIGEVIFSWLLILQEDS
ncbi:MAG: hypothetical protein ACI920_003758, partial [Saprospiraceae bacterium]